MRTAFATLTLAALCGIASAQHVCRGRAVAAPVVYHAPAYHAPHVAPVKAVVHDYEYAVKAVKVVVQPDYYYSVSDGYRDSLLADAIAFRILQAQALREAGKAPAQTAPVPRYKDPPAPPATMPPAEAKSNTPVSPAMVAVAASRCVKCHNGPEKNGIDLSEAALALTPKGKRWHAYALANSGEMPKGATAIPDDEVKALYEWAKSAK